MSENFAARMQRLAGVRTTLAEKDLSIADMRGILKNKEPKGLDARLRFASAEGAVDALDQLAPEAHEAILHALASVLDRANLDPEIEIADLLEVVFGKYGTDPDKFVEH